MKAGPRLVGEALAAALSQKIASALIIVMISGMCLAVLLTSGRAAASEREVLASIDTAGTRSIIFRADPDSGLDSTVIDRIANLTGIEWAGAFGAASDASNSDIPGSTKVPVRTLYTTSLEPLGIVLIPGQDNVAFASPSAVDDLGFASSVGNLTMSNSGNELRANPLLIVPDYLGFLQPLVVVPRSREKPINAETVSVLVVVARSPDLVAPTSAAVSSLLAVSDPSKVSIETSAKLADLRSVIQDQLGDAGRALVLIILGATAVLVGALLLGLVAMRRRDFGRRRALGATRSYILGLLVIQLTILSALGAAIGCASAALTLILTGGSLPAFEYFLAVAGLAAGVGILSSLLPAVFAATRDPARELRVP